MREIHRPYRDSIRVASDYLLQHAAQDELVYVPAFADREALTFTIGHRVLFCCVLDEDSPLPPATVESLGAYLVTKGTTSDWIVLFGKLRDEYWDKVQARYAIAAQPDVFFYPTQRPELNAHAFRPLPAGESGVHILQRRPEHRLQEEAAALLRRKRYAEALACYREALAIAPDYVRALAGMGEALLRLARYDEALAALARALALQPEPSLSSVLQRLMGRAALWSRGATRRRPSTSRAPCSSTRVTRRRSTTSPCCASGSSGMRRRWSCTGGWSSSLPTARRPPPTSAPRCTTWTGSTKPCAASSTRSPWSPRWKRSAPPSTGSASRSPRRRHEAPAAGLAGSRCAVARSRRRP